MRARVTGHLPHESVLAGLLQADLVIIPSRAESYGLVLMEAVRLGIPRIITAATGGLLEQAQAAPEQVTLFTSGSVDSLVAAIDCVKDKPVRRKEEEWPPIPENSVATAGPLGVGSRVGMWLCA